MSLGETYKVNGTNNANQGYTKFKQKRMKTKESCELIII